MTTKKNILILGGTSEASELVGLLAEQPEFAVTLSLAGRTKSPILPNINCRIGGFGGADGLVNYLKEQNIDALICATHPFAAKMPFNAFHAAQQADIPIIFILRPAWKPQQGDNWIEVENHKHALSSVIRRPSSIFLTVGRLELSEYAGDEKNFYLIRSIDEIAEKPVKNAKYITARPPFTVESERELMKAEKIDFLITKNSGGAATEAKLLAARELKIPVILIKRPPRPDAPHVAAAKEAIEWLDNISACKR